MILRRYGHTVTSVAPNFDSHALTEISFTRNGEKVIPAADFGRGYERTASHELTAHAAGDVQDEVKTAVLEDLQRQLETLDRELAGGALLLIENEPGKDQAKTRGVQRTKVVQGANRLHFEYSIDPPLKLGVYVERSHESRVMRDESRASE